MVREDFFYRKPKQGKKLQNCQTVDPPRHALLFQSLYLNLSNSISTSVAEWYKASVVRGAKWVRFPPPVKVLPS